MQMKSIFTLGISASALLLAASVSGCAATNSNASNHGTPEVNAGEAPDPSRLMVQGGADDAVPMDGDAGSADESATDEASRDEAAADGAASEEGSESAPDVSGKSARPVSNVRYYKVLVDKGNATLGDGYRLAFNLWKLASNDPEAAKEVKTFDEYKSALMSGGLIDGAWSGADEDLLTHEEAAYLFARAIELEGGVLWTATGLARYAHREMVDHNLLPNQSGVQYISGPEIYSAFRDCKVFVQNRE